MDVGWDRDGSCCSRAPSLGGEPVLVQAFLYQGGMSCEKLFPLWKGEGPLVDSLPWGERIPLGILFSWERRLRSPLPREEISLKRDLFLLGGVRTGGFFENLIIVCIPTCARSAQKIFWGVFERKKWKICFRVGPNDLYFSSSEAKMLCKRCTSLAVESNP